MIHRANAAPPVGSFVFETFFRVRFHEVDALGHVNNAVYLNYMEQAAIDHAVAVGLDMARLRQLGGVFVARRHEVAFLTPAVAGDILRVVTWLTDPRGARVERHYRVLHATAGAQVTPAAGQIVLAETADMDGSLVAAGVTEWAFVNDRGLPRRIPPDVAALFSSQATAPHGQQAPNEKGNSGT